MEQTAYIDGDILPYKVGFATQRMIYLLDVEGEHSCSHLLVTKSKAKVTKFLKATPDLLVTTLFFIEEPLQAINTLKLSLNGIVKGSGCKAFKVVLSGKDNFREQVATIQKYKGNRDGSEKPYHWQLLRDWLAEKSYTIISEGEEADDVLSKAMMQGHVGCTIDKDLNNTPGDHYNFNKQEKYHVTEEEAMHNFYTQCLTGDTADHIPGVKGIGPAKAKKLLSGCITKEDYESCVRRAYKGAYVHPVEALTEIGQLLWMRRKEGEVWLPSNLK
jgi:hypothetical protein